MSDDNRYDGLLRAAEEAVCLPAWRLTAEGFEKALEEMWNPGRTWPEPHYGPPSRLEALGVYSCRAVLFPLEPPQDIVTVVVHEACANGIPLHPLMLPYGAPVQGPRPVACAREPHEGSPWHWADGTWWR